MSFLLSAIVKSAGVRFGSGILPYGQLPCGQLPIGQLPTGQLPIGHFRTLTIFQCDLLTFLFFKENCPLDIFENCP